MNHDAVIDSPVKYNSEWMATLEIRAVGAVIATTIHKLEALTPIIWNANRTHFRTFFYAFYAFDTSPPLSSLALREASFVCFGLNQDGALRFFFSRAVQPTFWKTIWQFSTNSFTHRPGQVIRNREVVESRHKYAILCTYRVSILGYSLFLSHLTNTRKPFTLQIFAMLADNRNRAAWTWVVNQSDEKMYFLCYALLKVSCANC